MTTKTSTAEFDVLHALKVKGLASDEALAALTGLASDTLTATVDALRETGFVLRREGGRISGTMITPAGREEYERLATEFVLGDSERVAVDTFHEAFRPINGDFKKICSAWQVRPDETPNDHTDPDYDASVVAELGEVHERVSAALDAVGTDIPRLGRYSARLSVALQKVRDGDTAAFARPMYDSYHDIWMELHQDLLLTSGRERGAGDE
ncbi:MarR family winged helix-turn-helix transcriptional regulator [Gordonia sp. GONU]|uniref:MarR family winged helix-turn-helix transcriptional regulator n=1 Tax=Gordonia TaxID=2053 RepID=UPI0021AC4A6A|nr:MULTISPECIES: MarR family winged helix-turn-helix transcriptional regulator [Gordonia]MCR8899475.1 MarR family winged helix-turn-helix transcriptional regulator [Gordonia sp. GONU]MCZ0914900.1 MarR family winged helix-turn-helix transcriptional regulator [Gordonia amicalis]